MKKKNSVYIIAEIGVNHNGSLEIAKKSIYQAKISGADAVKFQTFKTEKLTSKNAEMAAYQKANTGKTQTQFEMLKALELKNSDFIYLRKYCEELNIEFLSTPFDEESASFLKEIGVNAFKIGSGDLTNIPFLRKIDLYGLPVLLSTGMSNLDEVNEAVKCFNYSPLTVLHCTSNYPAQPEDINLLALNSLKNELNLEVGYSDHSLGYDVAICAVAMGARVLEKHFTLDNNLEGPDHKSSLNPQDFKLFVDRIRNCEIFMGDGIKKVAPSELDTKEKARKSLVVTQDLKKGEILTENMLEIKRPGSGISPNMLYKVIGRELVNDKNQDELLYEDDLVL